MNVFTKAGELGVQTEFDDARGQRQVAAESALQMIVDAMPEPSPHRLSVTTTTNKPGIASDKPSFSK